MPAFTRNVILVVVVCSTIFSTLAFPYDGGVQHDALIRDTRRMTNAERLARGLSPNKPDLRRSPAQQRRGTSATITTSSAPTTSPSPPPIPCATSGNVKVVTSLEDGYLDKAVQNPPSHLLSLTPDISAASIFCLTGNGTGPLNLEGINYDTNLIPAHQSLAVVTDSPSDVTFGNGSFTQGHLEFGATTQPFDKPQDEIRSDSFAVGVESAIWYLDPLTNILTPQWVDPDGTPIPVEISWSAGVGLSNFFVIWGPGNVQGVTQATLQWSPIEV